MAIVISSRITMFHSVEVITSSRTTVCSELGGCQRLMGIDNRHVLKCCTPLGIDYRHVLQRCSLRGIDNTHRRGVWGILFLPPGSFPPFPLPIWQREGGRGAKAPGEEIGRQTPREAEEGAGEKEEQVSRPRSERKDPWGRNNKPRDCFRDGMRVANSSGITAL